MKTYEQKFDEFCEENFIPANAPKRIAISELFQEADAEIADLKAQEKPSEPELPYVDCEIYVDGMDGMYVKHGMSLTLSECTDNVNFIGFVFADGSMSRYSPWRDYEGTFCESVELQAERATHVRFKREA